MGEEYITLLVHVDIYKTCVLFFFGGEEDFCQHIESNYPDMLGGLKDQLSTIKGDNALAWTININGDIFIYARKAPTLGVLLHEIIHASLEILNKVGIELSDNGEELTYLAEYIFDNALHELGISLSVCDTKTKE